MENEKEEKDFEWNLDTIPIEIFLHISTFIPSKFLLKSMILVNKHFYEILKNEQTWKIRQQKMYSGLFPPILAFKKPTKENEVEVNSCCCGRFWRQSCLSQEENNLLFNKTKVIELHAHIACVDSVHLFKTNKFLATGSRDRSICLWDVDKSLDDMTTSKIHQQHLAHKGWIWALNYQLENNWLVSASWDNFVKIWDVNHFEQIMEFKSEAACLALATGPNLIACGTFNKKVNFYDTRTKTKIGGYKGHKKCVLSLGMDGHYLVSCGEDGRVCLFDTRKLSVVKAFYLPQDIGVGGGESMNYPKSCSYGKSEYPLDLFYIGDIKGNVHLIDFNNFKIDKTYPKIHERSIQGVFMTLGSIITCSKDGKMFVHEPSRNLKRIHSIQFPGVELPQVHSLNNRVALAGGDGVVRVWCLN